ncbi:unnamed protein product [Caenorhabditis bovis]|uniref:Uncharacterized protein n=1 Tax=Caenorhabditis bovis TaxID=2654633 RepID=A0A8S1EW16_9PELO|nr:unnamed protein product [Caenorhabditis bovis]
MPHAAFLLLFGCLPIVSSLSCYICGDTNLDEFGECSSQFQLDCANYATRFPANERMYCRTTRHRSAQNNTFTIMKECITEQDHYKTFPEKGYRLDEECDLIDVQGEEVAYCLCRTDYCNRNTIADQFMLFEEKHPELFDDVVTEKPTVPTRLPTGPAPLKIRPLPVNAPSPPNPPSFAAPILNPPAIVPINDHGSKSSEMIEIRRTQLPSRSAGIESEILANRPVINSRESDIGRVMSLPKTAISEGTFVGTGNPIIPARGEEFQQAVMKCIQCGDGSLKDEYEECKKQVQVECSSPRSMCFTRQIAIGNGMFGMEKMCVLPEQLVNEFGAVPNEDSCGSSNGGRVHFCACTSPLCNNFHLSQQRQLFKSVRASKTAAQLASAHMQVPEIPMPPASTTPELRPTMITATTTSTTTVPPPSPHPSPIPPKPIIPIVNRPASTASSSIRCVICTETDMSDPTADCAAMSEEVCDESAKYCATKQTQMSTSSFAMEKKCLSEKEAAVFLPGETLEDGCATSEGGMVNFCICSSTLCNRLSLLQQAQMSGVRDSLEEQRILEEEIQKQRDLANSINIPRLPNHSNVGIITSSANEPQAAKPKLPPVFLDEDDSREIAKDVRTEEDIIRERQKEWAKIDARSSTTRHSTPFIPHLLSIFVLRLFAPSHF